MASIGNQPEGAISADRSYQVQGQQGVFAGGDVLRPHLLTTAIGQGAIAAESRVCFSMFVSVCE